MKICLDQSPLQSGHAIRGIGNYTRQLHSALSQQKGVELLKFEQLKMADLVHYPYFDLFASTLPLAKSKPTVVTIHDVIPLLFPDHYPVGIKGKLALAHQKLALKNVAAIITDSDASKKDIHSYLGVPIEKIQTVYLAGNPALTAQDKPAVERVRNHYQLPLEYVLYVGDINYNKNVPQLIKALKYLPENVHLVCIGSNFYSHPIPEWQAIETQLALSNVADRVHFLTDIKADDTQALAACYSGALAYVQPSLAEGFGLPVLEAMQCRVPVVVAHNSSLIEIGNDVSVWVETDAESIAKGIKEVLGWSASLRQDKAAEGHHWSQKFTWPKTAAETLAIYQSVLKKSL